MKLLQNYASPLVGLLKDQQFRDGESYRLIHFVIRQPVEEGLLLYNVLTKAVVLLTPEEARTCRGQDVGKAPQGHHRLYHPYYYGLQCTLFLLLRERAQQDSDDGPYCKKGGGVHSS